MVVALFILSGFAAIVYQVLWVRELGLIFGGTAQAAAITIAIFFAGLAAGGRFWGLRASRYRSSLRVFGLLEIGVAVAAVGYFGLVDLYHFAYPLLYRSIGDSPLLDSLVKAAASATMLFPASFLMGGTFPVIGQYMVGSKSGLGRRASALYGVNTLGSAAGALAAGFFLPVVLGFRGTYLTAIAVDAFVGMSCLLLSRSEERSDAADRTPSPVTGRSDARLRRVVRAVAFCSGFAAIGMEVLWTRLLSQVLQNSVYTYAIVLTSFLLALATGALLASALASTRRLRPGLVLPSLLLLAGAAAAITPWLFVQATGGLRYLASGAGWDAYIAAVAGVAFVVMFWPGALLGTVFPYLMRVVERERGAPGASLGRLVSLDTVGAIAGSLIAAFLLLPYLGTWRSVLVLSAVYPAMLAVYAHELRPRGFRVFVPVSITFAAMLLSVNPAQLTGTRFGVRSGDTLVEAIEGPQANASVVDTPGGARAIRVNNYYTLGTTGSVEPERNQALIPILQHPDPRRIFFLGMGTGITAGAALPTGAEEVVVCEISPEVVELAERHFDRWTFGLFSDERASVHAEDGRNCLGRDRRRYDLIISDLFTPWRRGIGNLYTVEHYRIGFERLADGGIYVQWIPLYQVSDRELGIIARTMNEVFPQVIMWRGDLFADRSIVALVGHRERDPLDPAVVDRTASALGIEGTVEDAIDGIIGDAAEGDRAARAGSGGGRARDDAGRPDGGSADAGLPGGVERYSASLLLPYYVGNIGESGIFEDRPLNTDDRPIVEYLAPRTHRRVEAGEASFVTGGKRERLYEAVRGALPPERDPYLRDLPDRHLDLVRAGHAYSRYAYLSGNGNETGAEAYRREFFDLSGFETAHLRTPAYYLERATYERATNEQTTDNQAEQ